MRDCAAGRRFAAQSKVILLKVCGVSVMRHRGIDECYSRSKSHPLHHYKNTGINSILCLEEKKKERSFSSGAPLVLTDDDGMCLPI